jgi:Cof subfamily protein (haloacid dehalogenase superfamily)
MTVYQLIALDMDGTLLDSHKKILASSVEAIKKAHEAHKNVCLSTGRGFAELSDYKETFPYLSCAIMISGGLVMNLVTNEVIYKKAFTKEQMLKIREVANREDIMVHILTAQESITAKSQEAHMERYLMSIYQGMFDRVCTFMEDPILKVSERDDICKINLYHETPEARQETYNLLKDGPFAFAFAEETSLEITPLNVTKGSGLKALCKHIGLDLSETIAVGDAPNDENVLKTAGLSVAMGNASDEIKAICDVVVKDNDSGGIAEAIEKYLLGEKYEA